MNIGGIRYRIQPSFFVMTLMLSWDRARQPWMMAEWAAVVLVSVTIHELGHALVAKSFGLTPSIELHAMGGTTSYPLSRPLNGLRHAAIALAGPFAGFLAGLPILLWRPEVAIARDIRGDWIWVNLGWGMLNLLPVLPLDGGHVVQRLAGDRVAKVTSIVIAASLGAVALYYRNETAAFLLIVLLIMTFGTGRRPAPVRRKHEDGWNALGANDPAKAEKIARDALASNVRDRDSMQEGARLLVWSLLKQGRVGEALRALDEFPPGTAPDPRLRGIALLAAGRPGDAVGPLRLAIEMHAASDAPSLLLRALLEAGRLDEALEVSRTQPVDAPSSSALCAKLFQSGRFDEAVQACEIGFARSGDPTFAYNAACSHARAGRVDAGIAWLRRAVEAGFKDATALDTDPDLATLHASHEFRGIRERLV